MLQIARFIDALNEFFGRYNSYLILPLIGVIAFEVLMRYGFNSPTVWAFELTVFIYGVHFMLALGHCHKHDGHVAIDVFEAKLPQRPRTILRIFSNIFIFIPSIGMLSIWSVIYAVSSWGMTEHASSSWSPAVYPYKSLMALGFILFFLQGVAKLIYDFRSLRSAE